MLKATAQTLLLVTLVSLSASAGSVQKAAARQAEADAVTVDILQGRNVSGAIARVKYLGEEDLVCATLSPHVSSPDPRVRRDVAVALAQLGGRDNETALVKLAQDVDGAVRMFAAQGLGRIRSHDKALVELLADKTMGVRREAAKALGQLRSPKHAKKLLAAAQTEGEPEARIAMLVAVGMSGDKKSTKGVETYLTHSSESTRFAAAQALCLLGATAGYDFAKKMLSSDDKYERRQAVSLFEGARAKTAGPFLRPLLTDPDKTIAATAARILHQGGEPKMLQWLVMQSWKANGDERLSYEGQLEKLALTDEQRKSILKGQGIK